MVPARVRVLTCNPCPLGLQAILTVAHMSKVVFVADVVGLYCLCTSTASQILRFSKDVFYGGVGLFSGVLRTSECRSLPHRRFSHTTHASVAKSKETKRLYSRSRHLP